MSPSENMETPAVRETALSAGAWKAWADSMSARATTAADFIELILWRRGEIGEIARHMAGRGP